MKRTTRNAAKTKQEIIEKSAPIFNRHGIAGTSMQMLVEATGYQMGGIYRHFNSKMDLAKAVFRYNYESIIKENLPINSSLNPPEKLLSILYNYKKMVSNPKFASGCPLLNTITEVDDTQDEFRLLAKSFVKEVLQTTEHILEEGKTSGFFKSNIDPQKEALYLFASLEGAIVIGKVMKKAQPFFDVFDQIEAYLKEHIFTS